MANLLRPGKKKETCFLVLLSTFRNIGFAEVNLALGNEKKNKFSFCISLVFS